MELNVKKAFCSPFSDEKWYLKLIFPSIMASFNLIPNAWLKQHPIEFLVLFLIILIPSFALKGFFIQFAHNEIHDKSPLLPELKSNGKNFLKYGVKLVGVFVIYMLIFLLIAFLAGLALGFVLGIISAFLHFKAMIPIIAAIVFIPLGILAAAFIILVECIFFDNFSFKEALNYKRAWGLLSKAKSEIMIYFLLMIGVFIALALCFLILSFLKFTLILVPVLLAITQLISVNLKAQIYKTAKLRLEENTQNIE